MYCFACLMVSLAISCYNLFVGMNCDIVCGDRNPLGTAITLYNFLGSLNYKRKRMIDLNIAFLFISLLSSFLRFFPL